MLFSYKLRRVLRKAMTVGERVFRRSGILQELTYHVAETLGDVYPEIRKNLKQVRDSRVIANGHPIGIIDSISIINSNGPFVPEIDRQKRGKFNGMQRHRVNVQLSRLFLRATERLGFVEVCDKFVQN